VALETADIILVRTEKTYRKTIENLLWASRYNVIVIPPAASILYNMGILLSPAVGAILISLSAVTVALNAKLLKL